MGGGQLAGIPPPDAFQNCNRTDRRTVRRFECQQLHFDRNCSTDSGNRQCHIIYSLLFYSSVTLEIIEHAGVWNSSKTQIWALGRSLDVIGKVTRISY